MRLPYLNPIPGSRQVVEEFRGYNHNLRIGDGEFFDMKNMTSDYYPVLSPRGKRGVYTEHEENCVYHDLIAKDALCYVKDDKFYINENAVENLELEERPKQLVSMGAYVIILPDKKWVNTADGSYGDIEAFFNVDSDGKGGDVEATYEMCNITGDQFENVEKSDKEPAVDVAEGQKVPLWIDTSSTPHSLKQYSPAQKVWTAIATTYIKIKAQNIAANFSKFDAVKLSGLPEALKDINDTVCVLYDCHHEETSNDNDYIIVSGFLDETVTKTTTLQLKRQMPEMDFVIESGNRLWGCFYGMKNGQVVNEIYASKLGDFKNWECYMGISTDSYAASVGTDGQWTGAVTHLGYPLFFKENYLHKVYGSYPANFQIQTTECNGVQKGSGKSLAIVGTTLLYKGRSGVCAYDGSLPVEISYPLGNVAYKDAVGGAHGNKYYISMLDASGKSHLFVFDVAKSLWHREDDFRASEFCYCRNKLYALSGKQIVDMHGGAGEPVSWMAETGDIGLSSPDSKYISRINLRMSMDLDSEIYISIRYDFNDGWEQVAYLKGDSLRSFTIPIRPKRCDHLRLRIEGVGDAKIYSITKTIEGGSDTV